MSIPRVGSGLMPSSQILDFCESSKSTSLIRSEKKFCGTSLKSFSLQKQKEREEREIEKEGKRKRDRHREKEKEKKRQT